MCGETTVGSQETARGLTRAARACRHAEAEALGHYYWCHCQLGRSLLVLGTVPLNYHEKSPLQVAAVVLHWVVEVAEVVLARLLLLLLLLLAQWSHGEMMAT